MKTTTQTIIVALVAAFALGACTNPETPAGYEGYVYYQPLIFGKMEYRKTLKGPSSTGVSWRLFVTNIDMRERNFREEFNLLSSDDLKVVFEVNTRIRLRAGTSREIVEEWGGEHWYEWNVRQPLRTTVRNEIMKISANEIQLKTVELAKTIREDLDLKYKDMPIEVLSVDMGHFEFPKPVTEAIQEKIAKQQELERQKAILSKTEKEAEIRVIEALRAAEQQRIIGSTLDHLYLQREAVQVYRTLGQSKNKTILVLPNTADGTGMPLVKSSGARKKLSKEDVEFLEKMRAKYITSTDENGDPIDKDRAGEDEMPSTEMPDVDEAAPAPNRQPAAKP